MIKDSKILGPSQIPSDKELQEIMDEIFMKIENTPKYKIGDIVYLRFSDRPMKIMDLDNQVVDYYNDLSEIEKEYGE